MKVILRTSDVSTIIISRIREYLALLLLILLLSLSFTALLLLVDDADDVDLTSFIVAACFLNILIRDLVTSSNFSAPLNLNVVVIMNDLLSANVCICMCERGKLIDSDKGDTNRIANHEGTKL